MKSFRRLKFACCLATLVGCLAMSGLALSGQALAGEAAPAEDAAPPKEQSSAEKAPATNAKPLLQPPKQLLPIEQLLKDRALAKPPTVAGQQKVKRKPVTKQARRPLSANRRENPPFWPPQQSPQQLQRSQGNTSRVATYQLESLGRHIHLTPAMRWHLNRSGVAVSPTSNVPLSSATTASGQEASIFYPSVARSPTQKPFAEVVRPTTGIPDYWPLLLEGRQDPNTGLIIWTLP